MTTVSRGTFIVATTIMVAAIAMALVSGGFVEEGRMLLASPWGRLTLIDLYIGLLLFSMYVIWREHSAPPSLIWIAAFLVLGNLATAAYLVVGALGADSIDELMKRRPR